MRIRTAGDGIPPGWSVRRTPRTRYSPGGTGFPESLRWFQVCRKVSTLPGARGESRSLPRPIGPLSRDQTTRSPAPVTTKSAVGSRPSSWRVTSDPPALPTRKTRGTGAPCFTRAGASRVSRSCVVCVFGSVHDQLTELLLDVGERAVDELGPRRVPAPEDAHQFDIGAAGAARDLEHPRAAVAPTDDLLAALHPGLAELHDLGARDAGVDAGVGDGPFGPSGGASDLVHRRADRHVPTHGAFVGVGDGEAAHDVEGVIVGPRGPSDQAEGLVGRIHVRRA